MITAILAELTGETATIVGAVAGLMTLVEVGRYGIHRRNGRNGNGKEGCPGQTQACIDHMARLAVVESEQRNTKEWLDKLEIKVDKVLAKR